MSNKEASFARRKFRFVLHRRSDTLVKLVLVPFMASAAALYLIKAFGLAGALKSFLSLVISVGLFVFLSVGFQVAVKVIWRFHANRIVLTGLRLLVFLSMVTFILFEHLTINPGLSFYKVFILVFSVIEVFRSGFKLSERISVYKYSKHQNTSRIEP